MKFLKQLIITKEDKQFLSTQPKQNQNPYLDRTGGKRIWNDRYLNLAKARRHWQFACFGLFILTIILLLLVVKLSTTSQIKPYVVELNKGMPVGFAKAYEGELLDEKLIPFVISEFITNTRSIMADSDAAKQMLNKAYAFSANDTLNFLRDYYNRHNPFEKAKTSLIEVNILNTLKISQKTWQVTWDEIEKSSAGGTVGESRYLGTLTIERAEPNPKFLTLNPFGIYVTQLTWAKIQ